MEKLARGWGSLASESARHIQAVRQKRSHPPRAAREGRGRGKRGGRAKLKERRGSSYLWLQRQRRSRGQSQRSRVCPILAVGSWLSTSSRFLPSDGEGDEDGVGCRLSFHSCHFLPAALAPRGLRRREEERCGGGGAVNRSPFTKLCKPNVQGSACLPHPLPPSAGQLALGEASGMTCWRRQGQRKEQQRQPPRVSSRLHAGRSCSSSAPHLSAPGAKGRKGSRVAKSPPPAPPFPICTHPLSLRNFGLPSRARVPLSPAPPGC